MTPDHYAALGLNPTCDEAVIREVYLALMREYHPDKNPSLAAAERARAITAAYAVLGDPDKRLSYDERRGNVLRIEVPANEAPNQRNIVPAGLFIAAAALWRRAVTATGMRTKRLWGRTQSQTNLAPALMRSAQVVANRQRQRFKLARVRLHTSTVAFQDTLVSAAGSLFADRRKLTDSDIANTTAASTPDLRQDKSEDASRLHSDDSPEALKKLERSYKRAQKFRAKQNHKFAHSRASRRFLPTAWR